MGTRSEIYIRAGPYDDGSYSVVELWKHWDGYPDNMIPLFTEFAAFAKKCAGDQPHRLFYPTDLASLLIAFSFKESEEQNKKFDRPDKDTYPDIRPKGNISDCEYKYVLSLESPDQTYKNTVLMVKVFHQNDNDIFPKTVAHGEEGTPDEVHEIPMNLGPQSGIQAN